MEQWRLGSMIHNINCFILKELINGELLMNFQTIINSLGFTLLAELILTFVVVIGYVVSNKIHMDTVSWNG
jgi:hypothetical protein